ncbi:hypothetical protein M3A74_02440 [Corynebacterium appendicis]|uniref:hypothetical protein n=1 Tax=Corynebacterium appendicis TaxID=163202 RepID=UPI00223AC86C|nr:hypothetical protein [Corynebacterium appendicis]MCT1683680.1 hypothetical protein [Corynebacterium appendicis]
MRLSRPRLTATVLATAALTLTGCSSDQDSASGPVLATMGTSSAEAAADTSAQPTASASKSADGKDKKENEENGSAAEDGTKSDNAKPKDDRTNVTAGTVCGQVTSLGDGSPLSIVAMTDGVDCDEAMEVFSDYMSDSPSGMPPQGSGAFWTAPNGWTCGGSNYLFPGDEDQKFNKYPSCGPDDELVVAVDPARVGELPV